MEGKFYRRLKDGKIFKVIKKDKLANSTNGSVDVVIFSDGNHTYTDTRNHFLKEYKLEENNNVDHPQHYNQGKIECIDAMISAFGKEKVMAFCQCNAFKYIWRADNKNGAEDIKKAQWYQNKYIELQNG